MKRVGWKTALAVLISAVGGGFLLSGLAEGRFSLQGWAGSTALLGLSGILLGLFWKMTASPRWVGWAAITALFLRLMIGVGLSLVLPVWGHES